MFVRVARDHESEIAVSSCQVRLKLSIFARTRFSKIFRLKDGLSYFVVRSHPFPKFRLFLIPADDISALHRCPVGVRLNVGQMRGKYDTQCVQTPKLEIFLSRGAGRNSIKLRNDLTYPRFSNLWRNGLNLYVVFISYLCCL